MNAKAVILSVVGCVIAAVMTDLIKYTNALSRWSDNPDDVTAVKPRFFWQLFAARVVVGAFTGLQVGMGLSNFTTQIPTGAN